MFCALKIELCASSIDVHEKYPHWRVYWKAVHQIRASIARDVGQAASRTSFAHALNILVHVWPKIPLTNPVVYAVGIQKPSNWICMESNKNYFD